MRIRPALLGSLAAAFAAALAACSDSSAPGADELRTHSAGFAQPTNPTGRHIVAFTAAPPADFGARVAALGGWVDWSAGGAGLATVSGLSEKAASKLAAQPGVRSVAADVAIAIDPVPLADASEALPADGGEGIESQANPAGAFFFPRQWNLRAVGADQTWAAGQRGAASVSVFILDTGIDYLHADLSGLVDVSRSVDLLGTFNVTIGTAPNTSVVPFTEADTVAKYYPTRLPFTDLHFHGTHVAATVSSKAIASAGVTSQTTLVAVKVCAYLNTCPLSSVLNGVIYAADHGADVINLSLGGSFAKAGNGSLVSLINKTLNYATSRGVTIVVSAGNSAADLDHDGNAYKNYCNTSGVICVAATGPTAQASVNGPWTNIDASATYTNFGRSAIAVAAPGGNRSSFVYAACSRSSRLVPVCGTGTFVIGVQGTSMASPHVAGAAALLVPLLGRNPGQIRARLIQSADDLGLTGTDPFYGKGRLNVARAAGVIP